MNKLEEEFTIIGNQIDDVKNIQEVERLYSEMENKYKNAEKDELTEKNNLTEKERLEEACWYGLVKEMLPELFREPAIDHKVFLWKIVEGKSFLELDMGETPFNKESFYSIDPYSFLSEKYFS